MQVADLMTTELITATPEMTLQEVEMLFASNSISGAPVIDQGDLVGVISQSDVIRVLLDEQLAANEVSQYLLSPYPISIPALSEIAHERAAIAQRLVDMTVGHAMTGVPITVSPTDDVSKVAQAMVAERVHRVLVTQRGELVGLVSSLDLASLLI